MRRRAVSVVLLVLCGCSAGDQVAEREAFWSREAAQFFADSHSFDDLHPWLREHDVFYTFDDGDIRDGRWAVELETIDSDTFVCDFWKLTLHVTVDSNGDIVNHSVKRSGACL